AEQGSPASGHLVVAHGRVAGQPPQAEHGHDKRGGASRRIPDRDRPPVPAPRHPGPPPGTRLWRTTRLWPTGLGRPARRGRRPRRRGTAAPTPPGGAPAAPPRGPPATWPAR